MITVAISGGFDPIHSGHLRYIEEAAILGDRLVVILNSVEFLMAKKGYYLYTDQERIAVLRNNLWVDAIVLWKPPSINDLSVCGALEQIRPDIFAKGGDRRPDGVPVPEEELCKRLGIKIEYGVGGNNKMNSSSWLVEAAFQRYAQREAKANG